MFIMKVKFIVTAVVMFQEYAVKSASNISLLAELAKH